MRASFSKSSVKTARRVAWSRMISRKRRLLRGSSSAPESSVSAKPWIAVRGVLNSCETLATKSWRTRSRRRSSVTSCSTTTAPDGLIACQGSFERYAPAWPSPKNSAAGRCPWRCRSAGLLRRAEPGESGPSRSELRTTSITGRPSTAAESRFQISEKARLQKTSLSCASITATPSTMLRRIALERLRSPLSERIVRSIHAAVSFSAVGQIGEFVARPLGGQGTKISLGNAAREILEPFDARGEHPEIDQRDSRRPARRMTSDAA